MQLFIIIVIRRSITRVPVGYLSVWKQKDLPYRDSPSAAKGFSRLLSVSGERQEADPTPL
ncbi:hypothetical protein E2C01_073063 [Portunus trituberculatus]|uniref:Uncharacterized protein n=1 Tax=Portunus trituberculatus TaxID=210409 RepID=A0A5B7ID27_PORTR|nr:hypothetical protein [Portunus trituberculatus]